MNDVNLQAKELAKSMFAVAQESGVLNNTSSPTTPELIQHAESSLVMAIESMFRLSEDENSINAVASKSDDIITAKAYWWGWRLKVPHNQVVPLINGTDNVTSIIEVALNVVPEVGEILALVLKAYVAVMAKLIKSIDKGKGVYLSQLWLVEGAIIASGGVLAGPALAAAFIPTAIRKS